MAGSTSYKNKYNGEKYDRINLVVNKGDKEKIKQKADSMGVSLNTYIKTLIENDLNGGKRSAANQNMEIYLF